MHFFLDVNAVLKHTRRFRSLPKAGILIVIINGIYLGLTKLYETNVVVLPDHRGPQDIPNLQTTQTNLEHNNIPATTLNTHHDVFTEIQPSNQQEEAERYSHPVPLNPMESNSHSPNQQQYQQHQEQLQQHQTQEQLQLQQQLDQQEHQISQQKLQQDEEIQNPNIIRQPDFHHSVIQFASENSSKGDKEQLIHKSYQSFSEYLRQSSKFVNFTSEGRDLYV